MRKSYRSDPKGRRFLSAAAFVLTIIAIAVLDVLRRYAADKFPEYMPSASGMNLPEKVIVGVMLLLAAVYVMLIVILLPMWYKTIRYTVTDKRIIARSGLFSRTQRIMKLSSVQNAVLITTPFSDKTCFNFISVNALGGRLLMMFLSRADCREIMGLIGKTLDGVGLKSPAADGRKRLQTQENGYFVAYSPDGESDYIYKDKASILTSAELSDIFDDFSGYTQLTFKEPQSAQLSFEDIDINAEKSGVDGS